ncbi:uncharacterized protein LOC109856877 isoform X2 [Pseudomyrmex gracilis]|nr:uncharacterized protein LOC109856877 isoform X2 [Pseudomyrmex gracilis]XP_020288179.1 uncharacterized protein LOC109856877 isoform X2 [Pseudomyrmex gracilis]XP_020288180.1 uncharacterized protein LOC109856877 isoform X2 [Pseudomyrmex gracilis]
MVQKRKEICADAENEDDEEEREIDGDQTEKEDAEVTRRTDANGESDEREDPQIAECAICHVHVDETNFGRTVVVDSEQNSRCPERYPVCQRCLRKISVQSGAQEQRSHASFSARNRDDSCDGRARSKRMHDSHPMYLQLQSRSVLDARRDVRRHTTLFARKSSEAIDSDAGSHVADLSWREEQSDNYRRQCQQQYGRCNPRRYDATNGCNSEMKTKSHLLASSVEHSRKPIRCPRMDCSVNVAFSALTHHFLFDHPEVPILSVEPGAESTLIVSYDALSCNSSRCLALLLVSGKLSDSAARLFGGNQINPKYRNRLPLPVLAARLHNNRGYASCEEIHAGGEGQCEKDVIVAWVAGLDVGDTNDKLRCSIQAVDNIENGGFRSLTYTGPVMSLRATQCPRDVFLAGDCIVLHEGLISHITSGCTSLNVNVIVH